MCVDVCVCVLPLLTMKVTSGCRKFRRGLNTSCWTGRKRVRGVREGRGGRGRIDLFHCFSSLHSLPYISLLISTLPLNESKDRGLNPLQRNRGKRSITLTTLSPIRKFQSHSCTIFFKIPRKLAREMQMNVCFLLFILLCYEVLSALSETDGG